MGIRRNKNEEFFNPLEAHIGQPSTFTRCNILLYHYTSHSLFFFLEKQEGLRPCSFGLPQVILNRV